MTVQDTDVAVEPAAGDDTPATDEMALIAASGDFDKAWPTLILATIKRRIPLRGRKGLNPAHTYLVLST